jgi:tRNA(Arg) A34 adenosine deaminase TadA
MTTNKHEEFMRRAIELSKRAGIDEKTGGVFGAVIVKDNQIIGEGYNQVIKHNDPTWHAEMEAIRTACKKMGSPHLEGCVIYTSAEPCPMCFAATMWAHIDQMYYGARVEDALKYGEFDDADFYAEIRKNPEDRILKTTEILRDEAVEIWKKFHEMPDRARY